MSAISEPSTDMTRSMYDAIVVGGGPAGLSAALVLGRCRRRVLVCDDGRPRNAAARRLHGFISRDGINPHELRDLARQDAARYGVQFVQGRVIAARRLTARNGHSGATHFAVTLEGGAVRRARKLLLATGVTDVLPALRGLRRFYGRGVHHCPYCDAWEYGDQRLVAFGHGEPAVGLALSLRTWSKRVTACTHGGGVSERDKQRLRRNGIALRQARIVRLEGDDSLRRVVLAKGRPLVCDALFFNTGQVVRSGLAESLGCERAEDDTISTDTKQRTGVPGLYLAGDADGDVQFAIAAAAEGATAAVAINRELQDEDRAEVGAPGLEKAQG
jgi:thioredoxin reductase